MKSADDWARMFKLHSCVGNKKFAKQIEQIQADTIKSCADLIVTDGNPDIAREKILALIPS